MVSDSDHQGRLTRLVQPGIEKQNPAEIHKYSKFIRRMRLVLPMIALGVVAVILAWSTIDSSIVLEQTGAEDGSESIGKNEVLSPRFESQDDRSRPYTITAKRAVQGETNEDMVILEDPQAMIQLTEQTNLQMNASQAAFSQKEKKLLLDGKVTLLFADEYYAETPMLHVDLNQHVTWTDSAVTAYGPAGTVNAAGLRGWVDSGILRLTGPARLVLTDTEVAGSVGEAFK